MHNSPLGRRLITIPSGTLHRKPTKRRRGLSCREGCQRKRLLHERNFISAQWPLSTKMPVLEGNQSAIRTMAMRWRPPTPNTPTTKPPCFMDCRSSVRSRKVPTVLSNRRKLHGSGYGVSKDLGNVLDQRTLADLPHGARIAQLMRMRWTHSEISLHFGDLRTLK